ncbi:MAG: SDR family NAD(P)-dependent oxidoreductase, partial [Candidatus Bathyarchaeota archaeon]|nr:SDR family NAD(P)-dependent oxidoreductase [Candidatus Bathyarchaeota archaeon]
MVLVTGGAGYVGSVVVRDLLERGEVVVSVDNLYSGDYGFLRSCEGCSGLRLVVGDVSSSGDLKRSLEGVGGLGVVVHLAAVSGLERCREEPERAVSTNVLGTFNVLELARMYGARVVFVSSAAVFGVPRVVPIGEGHPREPVNLYGFTKLAG